MRFLSRDWNVRQVVVVLVEIEVLYLKPQVAEQSRNRLG